MLLPSAEADNPPFEVAPGQGPALAPFCRRMRKIYVPIGPHFDWPDGTVPIRFRSRTPSLKNIFKKIFKLFLWP